MKTIGNILMDMWLTAKHVAVVLGISALTVFIALAMWLRALLITV